MRTRAERRHNSWSKARRKRNICRAAYHFEWYDNLHQYSKNKIHCSCPMCASKTNRKRKNWYGVECSKTIKQSFSVMTMTFLLFPVANRLRFGTKVESTGLLCMTRR